MAGDRVLLTGAAGFIGSALARRLARRGDTVMALARPTTDLSRLAPVRESIDVHTCELFDLDSWLPTVREFRPERVFHLAWFAEPGKYLTDVQQNLDHLRFGIEFARAMLALEPREFVATGTCFEYRMTGEPLVEEETPEDPRHIYSASKLALKNVALQLARDAGIPLVWARVFYLFGPYEDPRRLVPFVVRSLREGKPVELRSHGRQIRDFLHVDDVASGIDHAAKLGRPGIVNIGGGDAATVREFVLRIAEVFGRQDLVSFAPDDTPLPEPMRVEADSRRLRDLGWSPERALNLDALAADDGVSPP